MEKIQRISSMFYEMQPIFAIIGDFHFGILWMIEFHINTVMTAHAMYADCSVRRRYSAGSLPNLPHLRTHLKHRVSWFQRRHAEQSLLQQVCG